jgi:hypothetical protein
MMVISIECKQYEIVNFLFVAHSHLVFYLVLMNCAQILQRQRNLIIVLRMRGSLL